VGRNRVIVYPVEGSERDRKGEGEEATEGDGIGRWLDYYSME